jgi:hypothetical protein
MQVVSSVHAMHQKQNSFFFWWKPVREEGTKGFNGSKGSNGFNGSRGFRGKR